jgi:hypothetical protein
VPAPGDYNDGDIGGMVLSRGNRSTPRKPAPMPLYPTQIPYAALTRTLSAALGNQRLSASISARLFADIGDNPAKGVLTSNHISE